MFQTLSEIQLSSSSSQDQRTFEDTSVLVLNPKGFNAYKNKLQINGYNIIQWYKNYLFPFSCSGGNFVFFCSNKLKKRDSKLMAII